MTVLVAADLDNTLIFSRNSIALHNGHVESGALVCVEWIDGVEQSFMTREAAVLLGELASTVTVVPVTTRTVAQLGRVSLPLRERAPRYAAAANGGVLLVDGVPDADWSVRVQRELAVVAPLSVVHREVERLCAPEWTKVVRTAQSMFCYAVVDREKLPPDFVETSTAWAQRHDWVMSVQGRKIYWLPRTLTKAAAVAEVARRVDANVVLAAGDSLLDIDMLDIAHAGVHPSHGEIATCGWSASHVTGLPDVGVVAGEMICRWLVKTAEQAETARLISER